MVDGFQGSLVRNEKLTQDKNNLRYLKFDGPEPLSNQKSVWSRDALRTRFQTSIKDYFRAVNSASER